VCIVEVERDLPVHPLVGFSIAHAKPCAMCLGHSEEMYVIRLHEQCSRRAHYNGHHLPALRLFACVLVAVVGFIMHGMPVEQSWHRKGGGAHDDFINFIQQLLFLRPAPHTRIVVSVLSQLRVELRVHEMT
jgi:hypothetical protein